MKILFLQPGYAHYRDRLFEILSFRHDIFFLYQYSERRYPGQLSPKNISYAFADSLSPRMTWIGILYYFLKIRPEIVITSVPDSLRTIIAYCYCIILRKKMILWVEEWRHNANPKSFKEILRRIKFWLSKIMYKNADSIIAGGSASYHFVSNIRNNRNDILFSIQSTNDLKSNYPNTNARRSNQKTTFIYLSRIINWKGLDILIKAYHQLRCERDDIALLIGGEGPFKGYCEKLCDNLGARDVKFIGKVDPSDLSQVLAIGNVFVLPSYFLKDHYEAWGLVINESMSMALPIITTTAVGASFDLVESGVNGIVVQEGSVDELYKGMERLLTMDLHRMGQNSRLIFEAKNSFSNMADAFTDAINKVQAVPAKRGLN